jgi:hypothetical protein
MPYAYLCVITKARITSHSIQAPEDGCEHPELGVSITHLQVLPEVLAGVIEAASVPMEAAYFHTMRRAPSTTAHLGDVVVATVRADEVGFVPGKEGKEILPHFLHADRFS